MANIKDKIDSAFSQAAAKSDVSRGDMALKASDLKNQMKVSANEGKHKKNKKQMTKEATTTGASGSFINALNGGKTETKEEKLKGGAADKKTLSQIAKKHGVKKTTLEKELKKGMEVEKEHVKKPDFRKEIAMDHLSEDPKYYDKLKKVEKKGKKTETKEATGAASAGQYSGPAFLAKSTSKKDWRGASKTQIPGGKFVEVKKKCKTFPYCNQGDIKALKIFENEQLKNVIQKISKIHNISESVIKNIILYEMQKKGII
jgi:DNA-binding phage protein